MQTRPTLVAGNWKLNGTRSSAVALAESVSKGAAGITSEILLCPAFVHLADVLNVVGNTAVRLGAQNCAAFSSGAYTGECAAPMLMEFGCEYVIVGHSERRQLFAENDAVVAQKFNAAQHAGLTPILCVGETLDERREQRAVAVIQGQLEAVFNSRDASADQDGGSGKRRLHNTVIAYEPVWAIGTGETASPEQAQEIHAAIRGTLAEIDPEMAQMTRIIYGGSVKPDNAQALFSQVDIDGGLIGGASLKAEEFLAICQCA